MIALDVTSTARRPVRSGIPRVVRGLHRALAARGLAEPVVWGSTFPAYAPPRERQRANLADPDSPAAGKGGPADALAAWVHERLPRPALERRLGTGDFLLVPEVFQDGRIDYFRRVLPFPRGRAWALFHDALAWSLPEYAPADRNPRFEDYLATLARFDGIACISRESEGDLLRFWAERGLRPAPTHVLPLPMPLAAPRPTPEPPSAGRPRVLMVAALEPRKNHPRLLAACRALWERGLAFELELVGRAVGAGSEPVRAEIGRLRAAGFPLIWREQVDDRQLEEAYRACAFTVFPSIREGFGLPILESLWHHRPCVCGANGALGEVAAGGGCLFVEPTETASLAEGIARLVTDAETRRRLVAEATARTFLDWEGYADRLLAQMGEGSLL